MAGANNRLVDEVRRERVLMLAAINAGEKLMLAVWPWRWSLPPGVKAAVEEAREAIQRYREHVERDGGRD
ncbi:MAG: hypothetical protein D6687_04385 [Acidobacteria bacterium]|nr:MAG: hypothetical protein D6687_04385 [Acidobacteriota bacterium]